MITSQRGLDLIKSHEGLRLTAYKDVGGLLTIGYGHTENVYLDQKITHDTAEAYLKNDLEFAEAAVSTYVKVPLTQNMFDALVSLVFNIGVSNFALKQYGNNPFVGSTLLFHLNNKDYLACSERFTDFVNVNGSFVQGLKNRREDERDLFKENMYVFSYEDLENDSISDPQILDEVVITSKKKSENLIWIILIILFLLMKK